jgi:hypothetical protein
MTASLDSSRGGGFGSGSPALFQLVSGRSNQIGLGSCATTDEAIGNRSPIDRATRLATAETLIEQLRPSGF